MEAMIGEKMNEPQLLFYWFILSDTRVLPSRDISSLGTTENTVIHARVRTKRKWKRESPSARWNTVFSRKVYTLYGLSVINALSRFNLFMTLHCRTLSFDNVHLNIPLDFLHCIMTSDYFHICWWISTLKTKRSIGLFSRVWLSEF